MDSSKYLGIIHNILVIKVGEKFMKVSDKILLLKHK